MEWIESFLIRKGWIEPKSILEFMKHNKNFFPTGSERHWYLFDDNGNKIAYLWFKHILGGWSIMFYPKHSIIISDVDRISIKDINHLKAVIKDKL